MLGRYSMADNARVTLANGASTTSAISINPPVAPYNMPADPTGDSASGGVGIATITDSLTQPTKSEIITYTGLSFAAGVYNLTGITRGAAGSTAQTWDAGAYLFQALNVAGLLHPYLTPNQVANSMAIGGDAVTFSGSSVSMGALSAASAAIPVITGTSFKLGTQPANLPVAGASNSQVGTTAGTAAGVTMRVSADTGAPVLALAKARGTTATPAIVVNGDAIAQINAYAARTSALWTNSAQIAVETDGAQTTTSMPSRFVFRTVAANAIAPTEAMRISADNSVSVAGAFSAGGAATVGGSLQVATTATIAGAVKVGVQPTTDPVASPIVSVAGASLNTNYVATGANATAAALNLAKGRGTGNAVVANGDELGALNWYGHNGTGWFNTGAISSTVDAAVAGSAVITSIRFQLSATGTSAPIDVLRLSTNGSVITTTVSSAFVAASTSTFNGAATFNTNVLINSGVLNTAGARISTGSTTTAPFVISQAAPTTTLANQALDDTAGILRLTGTGGGTWTGLVADVTSRKVTIVNASAGSVTLAHENTGSTASNRFNLPGAASFVIVAGDSATLWYDSGSGRWRVLR